ncbi:MAG TPA: 50S ribosomal protein L13 [bacterium]|nr:50S ribosomal protein L13 [bacterium]
MKTYSAKTGEVAREWYVVDAEGLVLGRLATRVADVLRGKHKARFTPHVDAGDFVIVVNAKKIKLTGNKLLDKKYYHHSQYPGGMRSWTAGELLAKKPEMVVLEAVKGMLPKNRLNRKILTKLKVYGGPEHPHTAQQPKPLQLNSR